MSATYQVEKANTGGVTWRPVLVPLFLLVVAFWSVTQVSAALLGYASALGQPWLSIGSLSIYAPWAWIPWTLKYMATPAGPALMKGMGVGAFVVVIAVGWFIVSVIAHQKRVNAAQGLHGSASFASHDDVLRSGLVNSSGGVYVGAWKPPGTDGYLYLRDDGPAHVLGFAPTRSGKGVGLVIPTMLSWQHSVVAYDIKGELWSLTAGYRSQGSNVFCFAPTQVGSAKYNPFSAIRIGTPRETADIQIVADMLVDRGDNATTGSDGSYWDEAAKSFLTGMITHCCYVAHKKGRQATFRDLLDLIANPNKELKDTLKALLTYEHSETPWKDEAGNETHTHPVVARQARVMHGKEDKDRSGVFSTVMACLRLYDDPLLTENLSASSFAITDLVNQERPTSVYVVVPPSDRDRLRPIVRLFFSQVIGQLTERMDFQSGTQVQRKQRLLLMIDEFPSLGKMQILESALAYMAGYGLKAYLIAQDLTQIKGAYSEHEAVVANCHIRVAFAPNTVDTAELLSTMTGVTTVIHETATYSGGRFASVANQRSATVQFVERPLMTPDEVMRLRLSKNRKPGQQLVFIAGEKPILCDTILYYIDPTFVGRATLSPPKTP